MNQKISDEIAKNEAMRLALLAIADKEKEEKRENIVLKYSIVNKQKFCYLNYAM
ncbi:hypothetical protein B711_0525 [Chlamydia psittaci CP3]|nr:hypothetical protein B711_0525 [Chlamydia psittaci CP3]